VPDATVNYLFPATIKSHVTAGFGYQLTPQGAFNMSVTLAPEVSATNPDSHITTTHSQTNLQLMYSHSF
jgi:long-chain fatty acid transport protein